VTAALAMRNEDEAMRERKCIVTGALRNEAQLIRFVVGPDGDAVPDIAAKLPGRGMWVTADSAILERAIVRNCFSKAAKTNVKAAADLVGRVESLIVRRMLDDLGLARRSGALVTGFDNVVRMLESPRPAALLVEASDGAADGRRKLLNLAAGRGLKPALIESLTAAEMSVALGRENVIHAALKSGQLAERLIFEAGRLCGFRPLAKEHAGSSPAIEGFE
jgi:predicted RNA-binding protein YlxR (DUF448 family)